MRNCEQAAHECLLVAGQFEMIECTEFSTFSLLRFEHLRDADGRSFIPETTTLIDVFSVSGVLDGALHLSNWSFHPIDSCDNCWCRESLGVRSSLRGFLIDVDDMFLICNLQQTVTRSHALHSQADMEFPVRFVFLNLLTVATPLKP